MTWIIWLGLVLVAIAAGTVGLATYGAARWADSTKRLVLRLEGTRLPATTSRYGTRELQGLPAPVTRYFRAVLRDGQPIVSALTVEHIGTFNLKQPGEQTPWEGRMSNYQMRDGMLIPLTCEASWLGPKGCAPYWRGTISSLTYEFYKS